MPTDSTTITYKTSAGAVSQLTLDPSGASRVTSSVTITAGATDQHVSVAVDVSQLVSFLIYSSKDVTLKTNSSGSPSQIFTLDAGIGLTWNTGSADSNPLTVDITDLYFTNAGSADAKVEMSFLQS